MREAGCCLRVLGGWERARERKTFMTGPNIIGSWGWTHCRGPSHHFQRMFWRQETRIKPRYCLCRWRQCLSFSSASSLSINQHAIELSTSVLSLSACITRYHQHQLTTPQTLALWPPQRHPRRGLSPRLNSTSTSPASSHRENI